MGDRYARWLIAKGNSFSPAAASVVKLVERLRKEKWIAETGGHAIKTVERPGDGKEPLPAAITKEWLEHPSREELRLVWPVDADVPLALNYPLSLEPAAHVSYSLEIRRADEYVVPTAATIGRLPAECNCGEDLAFEWDDEELAPAFVGSTGIFAECEECSRTFDPSKGTAVIENPFDHTKEEVRGGAAHRFALVVDCGDCYVRDAKLAFAPALVALVASEFGRELYEVGCFY
jgi:hypothetical protein